EDAAVVAEVRLEHVDRLLPAELEALPAISDRRQVGRERYINLLLDLDVGVRVEEVVERGLVPEDAIGLEHPPDPDRLRDREAAVGLDDQVDLVAYGLADGADPRLGRAQPLEAELAIGRAEGVELERRVPVLLDHLL